jgi:hypothetical protein
MTAQFLADGRAADADVVEQRARGLSGKCAL